MNESTGVASFLGVPYAHPPVGRRRFAKPEPLTVGDGCWSPAVLRAESFGSDCVQSGQFNNGGSEDCLFVNAWVPGWGPSGPSGGPRPVMVYSYGGDLTDGRSSSYDMGWLAAETGQIVVTMNYRVNLFGFLALRALTAESGSGASGNYGFWDQVESLRWLRRNAAALGADASRVTFFGQSSGGTSVYALLAAPAARGLFTRAVSLSGSANLTMGLAEAEAQNEPLVAAMGCGGSAGSAPADVVACLRNLSAEAVQAAVPGAWNTVAELWSLPPASAASSPRGMGYQGIAVVDGELVTAPLQAALRSGADGGVPLVVSSLAQEADAQPGRVVSALPPAGFRTLVREAFEPWRRGAGDDVLRLYRYDNGTEGAGAPAQQVYDSVLADYGQTCASVATAAAAAAGRALGRGAAAGPVYQLYISARPSHPVWGFNPSYQPRFAFHSLDILAGLGHWDLWSAGRGLPAFQPRRQDDALRRAMAGVFANFTRDGRLDEPAGWASFGSGCAGEDGCYTVVDVRDGGVPVATRNLGEGVCKFWSELGFDERFWWSN